MKRLSDLKLSTTTTFNCYKLFIMHKLKLVSNEVYSNFLEFAWHIVNSDIREISNFDIFALRLEANPNEEEAYKLIVTTEIDKTFEFDILLDYHSIAYIIPAIKYAFGEVYIHNFID